MLKAASILQIPLYVTTQNRSRHGNTAAELHPYLGTNMRANIDKSLFSMVTPEISSLIPDPINKKEAPLDAIIVGAEAHFCVMQTALDLLEQGHRVYILVDGVSSTHLEERGIALARLRDAGAVVMTSECALFEILGDSKRTGYDEISALVKETSEETKSSLEAFARF